MAKVAEKRCLAPLLLRAPAFAAAGLSLSLSLTSACAPPSRASTLWGGDPLIPPLSAYIEAPDLEERLRTIDAETRALGLTMTFEARGKLPSAAGPVVVRAYEGINALGRKTHAVRAATSRGVILAVGPRVYPSPDPAVASEATELIQALVPDAGGGKGGAFQAATDLNGDGYPDVVLRNEEGLMEIWRLGPTGAVRYEVQLAAPPSSALDADGDGRIDFAGIDRKHREATDVISPELIDFAVFEGAGYTNTASGARAAHAKRAKALEGMLNAAPESAPRPTDEVRLRRALSLAWHAVLAGGSRKDALKRLDEELVPAPLRAEFDRHRSVIERAAKAPSQ